MQFKFELFQDKKMVIVKMVEEFDLDQYSTFHEELMTEIAGKGITSILWDARELDVKNVSTNHIEQLIEFFEYKTSFRKGRKSVWVVSDLYSFGMCRMFENIIDSKNLSEKDFNVKITMNYQEAEEWLSE